MLKRSPTPLATAVVPPEVTAEVTVPTGPFFCILEVPVANGFQGIRGEVRVGEMLG
jgi:hypothetical protein